MFFWSTFLNQEVAWLLFELENLPLSLQLLEYGNPQSV